MNELRNGGFELGNLSFWGVLTNCSVEIVDISPHRGDYMANVIAIAAGRSAIAHDDYIAVEGRELIECAMWFKAFAVNEFSMSMRTYDSNFVELGIINSRRIDGTGMWQELRVGFKIPAGISYIRPEFVYDSTGADEHWNLDDAYFSIQRLDNLVLADISLCSLTNLVASGDTADDLKMLLGFREYWGDIDCTSLTGTNPTLTVSICELDHHDNEVILGTFTLLNAVGSERIKIDSPVEDSIYVKYTEGGTWTDCDFKVRLSGKG